MNFICDQEVRDYLEAWADREGRTMSNLVERIVTAAVLEERQRHPIPSTIFELVAQNLDKLKNCGVGNLEAIAKGENTPTRPDFCKIAAALGLKDEEKKRLWDVTYKGEGEDAASKPTKSVGKSK